MKRIESIILKLIAFMVLLIPGNVLAESPQFPDIDRMVVPRLNLDIEVKKIPFSEELGTWDITEETGALYWLEGTSHPEYGGNTVIAAHYMEYGEPGPLYRVRDFENGDEIYLYSGNCKYTYKVDRYQYVPIDYMEYMKNRTYALTLVTCGSYDWSSGEWIHRTLVLADLVQIDFIEPENGLD